MILFDDRCTVFAQFTKASDTDPSLRSEYEGVCAFSCAMLVPQLLAALQLIFTKEAAGVWGLVTKQP